MINIDLVIKQYAEKADHDSPEILKRGVTRFSNRGTPLLDVNTVSERGAFTRARYRKRALFSKFSQGSISPAPH